MSETVGKTGKALMVLALIVTSASYATAFDYKKIMTPIQTVLCGTFAVFLRVGMFLAALVFLAAAVQWVASRDDVAKRKQAKTIMIQAIIGLILLGLANVLIEAVGTVKGCTKTGTAK